MLRRVWSIARHEVRTNLTRPLFWFWIVMLGLVAWGLASGSLRIQVSGDSTVGGTKQWLTSEFAFASLLTATFMILYNFFLAIASGMTIIRDEEMKVGAVLHATPLQPSEYIWGKYLGGLLSFGLVMIAHVALVVFFYHVFPSSAARDIRGPLVLTNYIRPVLMFGLPAVVFISGISLAIGQWSRKPILVFVLPTMLIIIFGLFLNNWSPEWLPAWGNQALIMADPYGIRWLNEMWFKVDRGATFYNSQPIVPDALFLASRLMFLGIGVVAVWATSRNFVRKLRGQRHGDLQAADQRTTAPEMVAWSRHQSLGDLAMGSRRRSIIAETLSIARFELRELRWSPGLYLFVPFIILETIGVGLLAEGAFGTPLLHTSGSLAMTAMNTLSLLVCLLLLFYTVESQLREVHTELGSIYYATPARSFSMLMGKTLANAMVGVVILTGSLLACAIVLLVQGKVGFSFIPFLLVWGLLLIPTYIGWSALVSFVIAVTRNRYTTYAVAAALLAVTLYRQLTGKVSWVGNWNLWSIGSWSDISVFELDRTALILNRLMILALAVLFTYGASRMFGRRGFDAIRVMHRLRPRAILRLAIVTTPLLLPPVVLGSVLWWQVDRGFQGDRPKDQQKDYWKQNLATWRERENPAIDSVDLDLRLEPAQRWLSVKGHYVLVNPHDEPLTQFAVTGGLHWENPKWTMNDEPVEPDDRSRLYVFTPESPLASGDKVRIGFEFEGRFPKGITKNGGGNMEFILPSGVVLTSFSPSFAPVIGYLEQVGVDEDNQYESRRFDDRFFEGITPPAFGGGARFSTRIKITGPAEFTYNSVGAVASDEVNGQTRTTEWRSDHPVSFFNVVAGQWTVHEGNHTKIFYDPKHNYNIGEIASALDGAYEYYSEWFAPYPWQELKLSEFPNLASYAQGFPTNITFSEGIGFLTKDKEGANAAFLVTAHESAHQWWGNILVPGRGPGGNILSEGMAHFSTGLLIDQVKGMRGRIEFFERIEKRYNEQRSVDAERPLVQIDGSKNGDTTVTYDKGGWVFWMLLNHMGRDQGLKGIQAFIAEYQDNADYPVLQDFIASLRPHAPDVEAFDSFCRQWFHEVVVPEFKWPDEAWAVKLPDGRWRLASTLTNSGTGTVTVEVAATRGERFSDDEQPEKAYQEARATVTVAAGQSVDVVIESEFLPDKLLVDPDALVLQRNRKKAVLEHIEEKEKGQR